MLIKLLKPIYICIPKKSFPNIMVPKKLFWWWQRIILLLCRRRHCITISWCSLLKNLKPTIVFRSFSYFLTKSRSRCITSPKSSIRVLTHITILTSEMWNPNFIFIIYHIYLLPNAFLVQVASFYWAYNFFLLNLCG